MSADKKNRWAQISVLGPLMLAALAIVMLHLSWQRWPDVLVDFGRELYVPWQLNQGQVLYRDITHLYGPFSHYFNALLFRLFDTGILTIAIFNIGLIIILTGLIYRFFQQTCDAFVAVACGATFLSVFAFSQYVGIANYNFVCPYSHEITHGVILSFLAIYVFTLYLRRRQDLLLVVIGLSAGLTALTKVEVFAALLLALFCGLFSLVWLEGLEPSRLLRMLALVGLGFLLPIIGFLGYFSVHLPMKEALEAIATPFTALWRSPIVTNIFYQSILGTDRTWFNLSRLLLVSGGYTLTLAIFVLLNYVLSRIPGQRIKKIAALLILGTVVALAPLAVNKIAWLEIARPFPLLMLALGGYLAVALFRLPTHQKAPGMPGDEWRIRPQGLRCGVAPRGTPQRNQWCRGLARGAPRQSGQETNRLLALLSLSVFSFTLLLKMLLNTHVFHYGFALAMPAGLLLVMVLVGQLPKLLGRLWNTAYFARALALILVGIALVAHLAISRRLYALKTYPVGSGADMILAFTPQVSLKGIGMNTALQKINELMDEGDTFVVFPEGVLLNYLARRPNPTPYFEFTPPMVKTQGEANIIAALQRTSPDYIILTDKDTSEHGARYFGRDYAQGIFNWLNNNYIGVAQIGHRPLSGEGFGVNIAKKKP